jgi:general secretion pathway protein B
MSLILDALRRADAERERERGAVPGLHAQPEALLSEDIRPRPGARRWHWLAIGALLALSAVLASYIVGRESPRQIAATVNPPAPTAPAAAAPAAPAAADSLQPVAAAPSQPVAEPAPWPTVEQREVAAASAPRSEAKTPPASASAGASMDASMDGSTHASTHAPIQAPLYTREQLPQNVRAELPSLTIGGAMYSATPANRSLIVNGRLYRENDQLATDLLLEQIKPKAAVLKFKGYRFQIEF